MAGGVGFNLKIEGGGGGGFPRSRGRGKGAGGMSVGRGGGPKYFFRPQSPTKFKDIKRDRKRARRERPSHFAR